MADAHAKPHHDYHLVEPSPWPALGAVSAFVAAVGGITWMHHMFPAAPYIFGVGVIGSVKVRGAIAQSIVGAGLNPVDDVYGDDDDLVTPGSTIRTLSAKSADPTSRFYASTFKSVKLPKKIKDVASDARFKTA